VSLLHEEELTSNQYMEHSINYEKWNFLELIKHLVNFLTAWHYAIPLLVHAPHNGRAAFLTIQEYHIISYYLCCTYSVDYSSSGTDGEVSLQNNLQFLRHREVEAIGNVFNGPRNHNEMNIIPTPHFVL